MSSHAPGGTALPGKVGGIELIISDGWLLMVTPPAFSDQNWDQTIALIEPYVTTTDINYKTDFFFDPDGRQQIYVFALKGPAAPSVIQL